MVSAKQMVSLERKLLVHMRMKHILQRCVRYSFFGSIFSFLFKNVIKSYCYV